MRGNSVLCCFQAVGGDLWGIVNSAGWSTHGEVEWMDMDTYRKIAEVNLFGVIGGLKLFLPLIRKRFVGNRKKSTVFNR